MVYVCLLVFFEPTDKRKAIKIVQCKQGLICSSPNLSELRSLARFISPGVSIEETNDLNEILTLSETVSELIDFIIVTAGSRGVFTIKKTDTKSLVAKHYPVKALTQVENVSGAGDCFASGFIYGMLSGYQESYNVSFGFESAKQALFCKNTVPVDLSIDPNCINRAEHVTYETKK